MSNDPTRRGPVIAVFSLVVLLVVLLIADRAGKAIAENDFATQAEKSGMGVRPSVDITGFPFLTQLAARDFKKVNISARDVPAGPLQISSINATATGVHLNSSFNGATVDRVTGTGVVTFAAIGDALSGGSGGGSGSGSGLITVSAAGPHRVRVNAGPVSEDATIQRTGPSKITVQVVNNGDLLSGLLNSLGSFSFTVPKLPAGMQITGLSVTTQGLVMAFAASHTAFTQ